MKTNLLKAKKFLLRYRNVGIFFLVLILSLFIVRSADIFILRKLTFFFFGCIVIGIFHLCLKKYKIFSLSALILLGISIFFWDFEEQLCILKKMPIEDIKINQSVSPQKVSVYILNLDRAQERWNFIRPQVEKIGITYERVSAVEGKKLSEQTLNQLVNEEIFCKFFKMLPEKGTIGCSLSHEKTWRTFLESDSEFALILEDDVQFDPKILFDVIQDLINKKDLWDIASFELNHHGCPVRFSQLSHEKSLVYYMTNVKHSGAYLINRMAAKKLLTRFFPIKMPLDHYFTRSWEFGIKFCGVEPRIAAQRFGDSQIKCDPSKRKTNAQIIIVNFLYNVYTAVVNSIYNLILWISCK